MSDLKITLVEKAFHQMKAKEFVETFAMDQRKGVQKLVQRARKAIAKEQQLVELYQKMNVYEEKYKALGYERICGMDEVGRGPLAGPVVSAGVILPEKMIPGLKDSKELSSSQREELYGIILEEALAYSVAFVYEKRIDEINILEATKEAMIQAYHSMPIEPDLLLIDALTLDLPVDQVPIISGDRLSNSIAAASIVAKVTRDRWMLTLDEKYPVYRFASNKGYGSKEHMDAIRKYGLSPVHRRSFTRSIMENR